MIVLGLTENLATFEAMTQTTANRLRILHIASWYPSKVHGTLGNFVKRHIEAISTMHTGAVCYAAPCPADQSIPQNSLGDFGNFSEHIVYFNAQKPVVRRVTHELLRLAEQINDQPFDLIHLHVAYPAGKAARALAKRWNIPLVVTEHWTAYHSDQSHRLPFWRRRSMRATLQQAQLICPVSSDLAQSIKRFAQLEQEEKFCVVPNVVDTDLFQPQPSKIKKTGELFQWLHISSLADDQKNISGLIRTVQRVRQNSNQFHVQIVGDGNPQPHQKLVDALGLQDCITVHGEISLDQVAEKMRNADALLLFSRYENFPCVIPEAWASGIPVLSTDVGGISEHLSIDRGALVESENETAMADAMQRWIAGKDSFDCDALRAHAVDHFSVDAVAHAYSNVYTKALESNESIRSSQLQSA